MEKLTHIRSRLEKGFNELDQLIQKMIQTRSYSGEEGDIVNLLVDTMKRYGFDEAWHDDLGNAIGRIGNGPVKILFDGHIDTVHVTPNENWEYPPFEGKIVDGKLYGRGVVDEKSAVAGFIAAGKAIAAEMHHQDLPFTLYVVGSVMEEDCDGYPLLHLIEKEGIRPDYVLLGEPTDMQIYRGQRGRMEIKISIKGVSAHGAHNEKGDNAIYKMARLLTHLEEMDRNLEIHAPLGKGALTVSDIRANAPSLCSVSDFCEIHIDRRLTIDESKESVLTELRNLVSELGLEADVRIPEYQGTSWKGTDFSQESYFPTWTLDEKHILCQAAFKAGEEGMGQRPPSGFWKFSTNGVATAGRLGIPTIGFAPGLEELAHSDKEYIYLKDLHQAALLYATLPFKLCELLAD
jgi:putative selenium metabolism hydrolase